MKIVISQDEYGRVVSEPKDMRAFNVYKMLIQFRDFFGNDSEDAFVLNRENALRLQEDIRLWIKEHPE